MHTLENSFKSCYTSYHLGDTEAVSEIVKRVISVVVSDFNLHQSGQTSLAE